MGCADLGGQGSGDGQAVRVCHEEHTEGEGLAWEMMDWMV